MVCKYKSEHVITMKHYLVMCVSTFITGVFLSVLFNVRTALVFGIVFVSLMALISTIVFFIKSNNEVGISPKKYILLPLVLILFFLIGTGRVYILENPSSQTLESYVDDSVWLYGTVCGEPKLSDKGTYYSFEMQVRGISKNNEYRAMKDKIVVFVSASRGKDLTVSAPISCWTDISYPRPNKSDDIFDYHTYLKGKNIFVIGNTGNINKCDELNTLFPPSFADSVLNTVVSWGHFVRKYISDAADVLFAYNDEACAMLKGVLLGDKSGFSDATYRRFSNSGISHIVAVSGMHLSILFAAISILFSSIRVNRKLALLFSLPCIVVFVSSAGFSPSVCRAALMLLLMIIATFISGRYNSVTALFFAFGVIVLVVPYSVFAPGLLLSFGATFGIVVYARYFQILICKVIPFKAVNDLFITPISLSFSSMIGTACLTVMFFKCFSWIHPLTNLWVIPLTSVVFCGGYIVCILHYFLPASVVWLLKLPVVGAVEIVRATAEFFGANKFAFHFSQKSVSPLFYLIYIIAAVGIYFLSKRLADRIHEKQCVS